MVWFRARLVLLIMCTLLISGCKANDSGDLPAEKLLLKDIDSITADIQTMYDEVCPELLYAPFIHIAFADIDFDRIPEFFYGYQTFTGSHNKIWYRAYSLKDRAMISCEHSADWNTYLDDKQCSFSTGTDTFIEGYYLNASGESCFVTKTFTGAVTQIRTDYVFVEYANSTLSISTGFECDKELLAIKQVWSPATLSDIEDDIIKLLKEYSALT